MSRFRQLSVSILLAVLGLPSAMAGELEFVIHNRTGVDVQALYASPSKGNDWGEDLLGGQAMFDGDDTLVSFRRDTNPDSWDFKLVDRDGQSVILSAVDLRRTSELTLRLRGHTPYIDLNGNTD